MTVAFLVRDIKQEDNFTFAIEWSDGKTCHYRLSDLQKCCPCASCHEIKDKIINRDVQAKRIVTIGRYALRIEFTSGCSSGIYGYDMLRSIGCK